MAIEPNEQREDLILRDRFHAGGDLGAFWACDGTQPVAQNAELHLVGGASEVTVTGLGHGEVGARVGFLAR